MNGSITKFMTMALVCSVSLTAALPVRAYQSPLHIFSINDILGDFDGYTYGNPDPDIADTNLNVHSVFCNIPDGPDCKPGVVQPEIIFDKEGIPLYPIDSEFGFHVVDFLGAVPKKSDGDYMEGWAGNIPYDGSVVGVKVSNSETVRYKVKPPMGTWCQGLGNTSIKCSTEHYSAMEHVLSCHEVIPYRFADPELGTQAVLGFPDGGETFDCVYAGLDDDLTILGGLLDGLPLTDVEVGVQMDPNDNTSVMKDIAISSDYSLTLKDDGKALYRWGGMIKRPNDIRLYARLKLPEQWKEKVDGNFVNDFTVTKAILKVEHWITNNPNDQLRPEDLENEAATGRKPDYRVSGNDWLSTRDCFESDADFINSPEDLTLDDYLEAYIPTDTFLKNGDYAENPYGLLPPFLFSSDLREGNTNAYYTSTNRDPFEWSYLKENSDTSIHEFYGSLVPLNILEIQEKGLVELVTGPRWRLRANKFGQDICGLEIPLVECSPPPFKKDNIKYVVGEKVTTVINLLDWEDGEDSPLGTSLGWVTVNEHVEIVGEFDGIPVTSRKPVALFNAWLEIEFDGEYPEVPPEWNVVIIDLLYQESVTTADNIYVYTVVENYGPYSTPVDVQLSCVDNRGNEWLTTPILPSPPYVLEDDEDQWFAFEVEQNTGAEKPATLNCVLEAIAEGDENPLDNTVVFTIKVKKYKE